MRLSPTEQRVFALLGQSATQALIAEVMQRSPKTIQTHVRHLKDKLGVTHVYDLIILAARQQEVRERRTHDNVSDCVEM
jgi:DNA-binding CsgD family transcriptional regulator